MLFFEQSVLNTLLLEHNVSESPAGHIGCAMLMHIMYLQCMSGTGVDVLVSRRQLSSSLGVSRNTINKAVSTCQDYGWLIVNETTPVRKDTTRMSVKVPAVFSTSCCTIMASLLEREAVKAVAVGYAFSARDFIERHVRELAERSVLLGHEQETIEMFESKIRDITADGSNLSRRKIQRGSNLSHPGSNLSHPDFTAVARPDDIASLSVEKLDLGD